MSRSSTTAALMVPVATAAVAVAAASYYLWRRRRKEDSSSGPTVVQDLYVYPVKSCAEIAVKTATPTATGLDKDRVLQVTDKTGKYCTPRDKDKVKLFHVQPEILSDGNRIVFRSKHVKEPLEIDLSSTKTTPVTAEVMVDPEKKTLRDYGDKAAKWFEKATDIPGCRLTGMGDGFRRSVLVNPDQGDAVPTANAPMSLADEAPYLLINQSSVDDLNRRLKERGKDQVDMRRFRPNIVIRGLAPYEEDSWKRIRIGATAEFYVWQRCGRCTMTTIDRDTLKRSGEPLLTLSTYRERAHGQRNMGVHLVPVQPLRPGSVIHWNDPVQVLEYDEERRAEWISIF